MPYSFMEIARTPGVEKIQTELGVDHLWRDYSGDRSFDRFTENEIAYISERDSFYLATVSETGWPYVQHRGGPPGFLKVLDDKTLAFADYVGNRQYFSLGNLSTDDRVSMILMDYPHRTRLKLLGRMKAVGLDGEIGTMIADEGKGLKPQRAMIFKLEAFDWNCPKYITPRYTDEEINSAFRPYQERLRDLEAENISLRAKLADLQ